MQQTFALNLNRHYMLKGELNDQVKVLHTPSTDFVIDVRGLS